MYRNLYARNNIVIKCMDHVVMQIKRQTFFAAWKIIGKRLE